ncbi:MAG: GNAT family N-acetyltransferase [Cyanobacteria bacterium]|nr:GNAT family N-acetyltransferase [Cyanobacteriota bacterium]
MRLQLSQCTIRPWAESDAASLQRHANNRHVSMHLRDRFPYPYGIEQARAFIDLIGRQQTPTAWAIDVDGAAVGGIGLQLQGDIERVSGEVGYWLGEPYWGRGIATEAVKAVTAEAFSRFELTRIYAVIFPEHVASIRVLEKAGFTREGHLRQSAIKDGRIRDQLLFATYRTL